MTPRIGLGCMRLEEDAPLLAAIEAGVRWLDTAHAYPGSEERIARIVGTRSDIRIITKVGMLRPDGGWEPDGRARTILEQARESAARLGRPADILMLHAPDPNVPLATSMRALAKARDQGLAHAIGLSNPTRRELDELEIPIAAVQGSLGPKNDGAMRGGIVAWCNERKIPFFAHSPLGGVAHAPKLARDTVLGTIARRLNVTPARLMLAYLLTLSPNIIPLVGARRVETAKDAALADGLSLGEDDLHLLAERFPGMAPPPPRPANPTAEVVIVMGLPGAGKTRLVAQYEGYERLNRDLIGGTLAGIAKRLETTLKNGTKRVVLDNTYLTRAARSDVIRAAHTNGAIVKCVHIDISLQDARINVAQRMVERYDSLLGGAELKEKARKDPNLLNPTSLAKLHRSLENPTADEGFSAIERHPFVRATEGRMGVAIPLAASDLLRFVGPETPVLLFAWKPDATDNWLSEQQSRLTGPRMLAVCRHPDGVPTCWCRPPLPGLWTLFQRRFGIDPGKSFMAITNRTERTMAAELGLREFEYPSGRE